MTASFPTIPTASVTQPFGNYNPKYYKGDGCHKGIDYGVPVGSPVYACMDGIIGIVAHNYRGYGRCIFIAHPDGSISVYAHLSKVMVSVQESVKAGHIIGLSGGDPTDNIDGDGTSTGPHLHWEIRPGKTDSDQGAVDPEQYCLGTMPTKAARVTASPVLNVRSKPVNGDIIRTIALDEIVRVIEVVEGWARLHSLRPEWVSCEYLNFLETVTIITAEEMLARLWSLHPELHY
jgi:murein DD-endopeptidase MepM/ murein hydrolase activator NlpD